MCRRGRGGGVRAHRPRCIAGLQPSRTTRGAQTRRARRASPWRKGGGGRQARGPWPAGRRMRPFRLTVAQPPPLPSSSLLHALPHPFSPPPLYPEISSHAWKNPRAATRRMQGSVQSRALRLNTLRRPTSESSATIPPRSLSERAQGSEQSQQLRGEIGEQRSPRALSALSQAQSRDLFATARATVNELEQRPTLLVDRVARTPKRNSRQRLGQLPRAPHREPSRR